MEADFEQRKTMRSVELEQVKEEMSMYEQEVISAERATMVLEEKCAAFEAQLRRRMNNELNFPPKFEGLVLGCIDAYFCK